MHLALVPHAPITWSLNYCNVFYVALPYVAGQLGLGGGVFHQYEEWWRCRWFRTERRKCSILLLGITHSQWQQRWQVWFEACQLLSCRSLPTVCLFGHVSSSVKLLFHCCCLQPCSDVKYIFTVSNRLLTNSTAKWKVGVAGNKASDRAYIGRVGNGLWIRDAKWLCAHVHVCTWTQILIWMNQAKLGLQVTQK